MRQFQQTPVSILDLSPICEGATAADAFRNTLDLAQHAERWGFQRFWLAEHHSIPGIASAATAVVIAHVAGGTQKIRVGAGGIMLPNHPPLVVAEQFGTLESLFPGRIDLGLGRAPGSDQRTAAALRRPGRGGDTFREELAELRSYFQTGGPGTGVHAIPGEGLNVPIWLLGSSDYSALLAAELGLPFAFASHFAPEYLFEALTLYRRHFRPSATLPKPHAMVGVNVFAADSDEEGRRLLTSLQQQFLNLVRGQPRQVPPPVDSMEGRWSPAERAMTEQRTRYSVVGAPDTVRLGLESILAQTLADEIMATASIFDHQARLRSFEILASLCTEPLSQL